MRIYTCVLCVKNPETECRFWNVCAAREVADETRNGHRNAKRNRSPNQENIALGLFSFAILERDVKR